MSDEPARVPETLIEFIREELLDRHATAELLVEDDLLGSGLVDSLGVMRLVHFIERRFGVQVPPSDVTIENFMTVSRISSYLENRGCRDGNAADG